MNSPRGQQSRSIEDVIWRIAALRLGCRPCHKYLVGAFFEVDECPFCNTRSESCRMEAVVAFKYTADNFIDIAVPVVSAFLVAIVTVVDHVVTGQIADVANPVVVELNLLQRVQSLQGMNIADL